MEEFYTINQAALALKIHPLTVRRYIKEGKLKAYRAGGNVRISLNDLRSFTQNFIPQRRQIKSSQNMTGDHDSTTTKTFTFTDPFFRMRGRGLSMSKLEQEQ